MGKCKWIIVMSVTVSMLLGGFTLANQSTYEKPIAIQGEFDASGWDFERDGMLVLSGEWEFYWLELLEPKDFAGGSQHNRRLIRLPMEWNNYEIAGEKLPANGFATLRLNVRIDDVTQTYGLKNKYFASASNIWINGSKVFSAGQVSDNPDKYVAQYRPAEIVFTTAQEEIEIVIQVANFHHRRVKLNDFFFGTVMQVHNTTNTGIMKDSALLGSLLVIAAYYVILYFIQRRDRAALYFSLFVFAVALRSGIVNERILIRIFPDMSAELMMKIGYLAVFITLPLMVLYIREVFKTPSINKAATVSKYAGVTLFAIILFTNVKVYDWMFQYALILIFVCAVYIIYTLIREGFFQKVRGASIIILGGAIVLLAAVSDYIRDITPNRIPETLSLGVLTFILLQAMFLAWRFNDDFIKATKLAQENEAMFEEIQELNDQLENKVRQRTLQLEQANRKLEQLSKIDSLTGIANRRYFEERLQQEWNFSLVKHTPLSVIMLDIDCFKQYNDNFGHIQGDTCLCQIAWVISNGIDAKQGMVARYGGEEFVVLLANSDSEKAVRIAEKLRKDVEDLAIPHPYSKVTPVITISLGVHTIIVTDGETQEQFINKADEALYKAKDQGRNQVRKST